MKNYIINNSSLHNYYPINKMENLRNYFAAYVPLINYHLDLFKIDVRGFGIYGDHVGLQVLSMEEFDIVHKIISGYSEVIKEGVIHERRNNTYKLNEFIVYDEYELQSIEMFEPKPRADVSVLKPGIEHIALKVDKYDELETFFNENNLPIDKSVEFGGSKFFKTTFINLVEIEFRNNYLWEGLLEERNNNV